MAWTKLQFIKKAFQKIGMAEHVNDADPEHLKDALTDLDAMMGEWHKKDIEIGWKLTLNPDDADIDADSGAPWAANSAIFLNLALRIAPDYGKEPSAQLRIDAKNAFDTLQGQFLKPSIRRTRGMPSGAGNNRRYGGSFSDFNPLPEDQRIEVAEPRKIIGFTNG